jgi:hypothetical protein
MKEIRHIVPLCDETLETIKVTSYLFEKYWPGHKIDFLGFKEPEFVLPDNHKFISLAPEQVGGAKKWTRYIESYVKNVQDEFLIFSLDDFFIGWQPDFEMLNEIMDIMLDDKSIGRFCLSYDAANNCLSRVVKRNTGYDIVSVEKEQLYRISTQPALWRREYLLKFLSHDWSPWNFEVDGSHLSDLLHEKIYATSDPTFSRVPTRWVNKGSVSRHCPGKVNVLGLSFDAIIDLLQKEFYTESQLQWGMWGGNDPIPQFFDLGGFNFHPSMMPKHPASPSDWLEFYHTYEQKDLAYENFERPLIVNLWDQNFSHTLKPSVYGYITSSGEPLRRSSKIIYMPFFYNFHKHSQVTVFTEQAFDRQIVRSVDSKIKIAWIMEPPAIHSWARSRLLEIIDEFDHVFTFDHELIKLSEKCHLFHYQYVRLSEDDWKVHEKTKLVSMIASNKTFAEGHKLRHEVAQKLGQKYEIDLYGSGYNPFPAHGKIRALKDYMFTIVIQNSRDLITDLPDVMATGTVPIFWGSSDFRNYYEEKGFITFETIEELEKILENLKPEDYYSRIKHVEKNFSLFKEKFWNADNQLADMIHRVALKN